MSSPISRRLTGKPRACFLDRMDDRAKALCALVYVLCAVLCPEAEWRRFLYLLALLLATYGLGRVPVGAALARLPLLLPVLGLVALSILLTPLGGPDDAYRVPGWGHEVSRAALARFGSVLCGSSLSLLAVAGLLLLCGFDRLVAALEALRLPRLSAMLLIVTHRYLEVLREEAGRMVRARDSRGRPRRFLARARVTGSMVGALFLRSHDRALRVTHAMLARGFDGSLPRLAPFRLRPADVLASLLFCGLAAAAVWA